jgi:hypothetical protein
MQSRCSIVAAVATAFQNKSRERDGRRHGRLRRSRISDRIHGASLYVVGIEADSIAGPFPADLSCFVEAVPADSITLLIGINRHSSEVQRLLAGMEVCLVNRPGFAGRKRERCDQPAPMSGYEHRRSSHCEEHTFFSRARRPVTRAILGDQLLIDRDSERYKVCCVTGCGELQSNAHSISIVHHSLPR